MEGSILHVTYKGYVLTELSLYLGPLSVLWVVEVTTSAYSKGLGMISAATSPEIWAMSANM